MRVRLLIIGLIVIAVAVSLPFLSLAQGSPEVQPGQEVAGRLTPDRLETRYAYQGQAGDRLSIAVDASFDTYVELQDDTWQRLAANDDRAEGSGSLLETTLTRSGLMYIYISSYSGLATGDYTLRLNGAAARPAFQIDDATPISYGQIVEGELDSDTESVPFSFEGAAGDEVVISLTTTEFDAFLTLEKPPGEQIASDDNSLGESDAQISLTLPSDGTYYIQVLDAFGQESGAFTLQLDRLVNGVPVAAPTPAPAPTESLLTSGADLALGSSIDGQLEGTNLAYSFVGRADQAVVITLTSDDFDPFLTLLDSSGSVLETDDDSAGNLNAQIEFTLPADGVYSVEVGSFFDGASGAFSLSLGDGAAVAQPTPVAQEPSGEGQIAAGETVEGELTRRQSTQEFTFEGEAGQVVTISQRSDDFDSFLRLFGPDGDELITDDDGGDGLNSLIAAFTLPENGTYTISAESLTGDGGDFELSLSFVDIEVIAFGDVLADNLSQAGERVRYSFEGQAGDVVIISLGSEDFDTYVSLFQPGQAFALAENDDTNGTDSLVGPVTLPVDGIYQIEARAYNDSATGRFQLSLSRPELVELESGQEAEAVLDEETPVQVYRINGQAGTRLEIRLSGEGEVSAALRGPDGSNLLNQSVFLESSPPFEATVILNQTGEHLLVLQPSVAGSEAEVTARLTLRELETLDDGPVTVRFSDMVVEAAYQFTGKAGQRYELVLEQPDGEAIIISPTIDITQNALSMVYLSSSGVDTVRFIFTVPEDGLVIVKINSYVYERVDVQVSIQPVE